MKHWPWFALAAVLITIVIIRATPVSWSPLNIVYSPVEYFYVQPGADLVTHGLHADVSYYARAAGNPLLTSLVLALSYLIFGESPLVSRATILLISLCFIIFLFTYLKKKEDKIVALITAVLVAVNPLQMTFAMHVSTDVLFMSLVSTAVLLQMYGNNVKSGVVSAIMLGLGLATKYVTVLLYPVIIFGTALKNGFSKEGWKRTIKYHLWYIPLSFLLALPVIILPFIILNANGQSFKETLELWRSSEYFIPGIHLLPTRFLSYLSWLGLFLGVSFLIIAFDLYKKLGIKKFLLTSISLIVFGVIIGLTIPISSLHIPQKGPYEMNLLALETRTPESVLDVAMVIGIIAAGFLIVSLIHNAVHNKDMKSYFMMSWVLIPFLLLLIPEWFAQRYMLTLLVPASLYTAIVARNIKNQRFVWIILILHVCFYLFVGYFADY